MQRKNYALSQGALEYLHLVIEKRAEIKNETQAIETIIAEHQKLSEEAEERLAETILKKFDEKYEEMFTRLKISSISFDKNSQIMMEVLNTFLIVENIKMLISTEVMKSPVLEEAQEVLSKRIGKLKQKKDHRRRGRHGRN